MNLHLLVRKDTTIVFFSETMSPDMLTLVDAMGVLIDQNKNVTLLDNRHHDLMTPDLERELLDTVRKCRRACYGNNYIVTPAPLLMEFYNIAAQSLQAKDITK